MIKRRPFKIVELRLGPLPVETINYAVRLELVAGEVVFSAHAQAHAYKRHPEDFPLCLPHTGGVVSNPLFVGDDFRNSGCIELISRIPSLRTGLLVALSVEPDTQGVYHVRSLYPISETKISNRLGKGYLRRVSVLVQAKGLTIER